MRTRYGLPSESAQATAQRQAHLASILAGTASAADDAALAALTDPNSASSAAANGNGSGDSDDIDHLFDPSLCFDCQDHPADLVCHGCNDDKYCSVCWTARHARIPARKGHKTASMSGASDVANAEGAIDKQDAEGDTVMSDDVASSLTAATSSRGTADQSDSAAATLPAPTPTLNVDAFGDWMTDRCQWIPVRLTLEERKLLRLLDAALRVSEYTDKVDVLAAGSRTQRMVAQIREVCQILAGLVVAADYQLGQELFADRDFAANAQWFAHVFELGRRHKIQNPEKMRITYGKMIYLLQDAQLPEVQRLLGFSLVVPIKTVHRVLTDHDALGLLRDPLILDATAEILPEGKPRRQVDLEIRRKEAAVATLARKYARGKLTIDHVQQLLYSIGDHHHYLRFHRDPCDRMIKYLAQYFHPEEPRDDRTHLGIRAGVEGARLTHSHAKQFAYVYQSLALWREVAHEMYMLWALAENDLLAPSGYRLRHTGQGLNRVQACPQVARAMHNILRKTQARVGAWQGSSVFHFGDDNVPNALMFIDKYTQVPRILLPLLKTLDRIGPEIADHVQLREFLVAMYGRAEGLGVGDEDKLVGNARVHVLNDFFRHAFDGSGADNFNSAGSCIDGRLTSAWNWCSQVEKKAYFPLFLLTGFVGFDGESFDV
ncbi:hypothetical protein BCR44DRAFT_122036 [Catenaria anguillulae PL171]|uniref:Non-canonical E2 ubiquitin-conjugating enzyme C-terminal domain-containing protein n=1 Tax=Catenaria anguillulae PL171 TaxID=765915 RepID=A0A1Y2HPA0_9FUNG|nr:hypothetical protein BCR44DRAFT_122036 [Catenaria anguillulae PL171]